MGQVSSQPMATGKVAEMDIPFLVGNCLRHGNYWSLHSINGADRLDQLLITSQSLGFRINKCN